MNAIRFYLGRYGRPLLYLAWFLALAGLLPGGAYESFLRPEFGVLLGAAVVVLLGFLATEMGRPPTPPEPIFGETIRVLILALPLAYLSIGRGVALDSGAFANRWTGPAGAAGATTAGEPQAASATSETAAREADLVGLCWDSETYEGKEVAVDGMLHHEPEVAQRYGGNGWLLYRFVVSCCAADAQPAAVMLTGDMATNWTDDAWVRATGRFTLRPDQPRPVPILELGTLAPMKKPRNPYLY